MGARRLAKRLNDALPAGITVSIGAATWDRTENAANLLRRADQEMYQVKRRHNAARAASRTRPTPSTVGG